MAFPMHYVIRHWNYTTALELWVSVSNDNWVTTIIGGCSPPTSFATFKPAATHPVTDGNQQSSQTCQVTHTAIVRGVNDPTGVALVEVSRSG